MTKNHSSQLLVRHSLIQVVVYDGCSSFLFVLYLICEHQSDELEKKKNFTRFILYNAFLTFAIFQSQRSVLVDFLQEVFKSSQLIRRSQQNNLASASETFFTFNSCKVILVFT